MQKNTNSRTAAWQKDLESLGLMRSIVGAPALRIARERDKLKEMEILATVTPARALTSNPIAYGSLPLGFIIFGQILASSEIGPS